ncbi:MAG TPA: hypothetical protein VKU02_30475 [Gemmataceae bacterium]|nr:hypothetical protein [Gemmataceae bacterium]
MILQRPTRVRGSAALGLVLLSTLYSGCQAMQLRSADDPYYEREHMWWGDYAIGFEGARDATLSALTHLKMPVYQEVPLPNGILIDTRTPDDFEARVILQPLAQPGAGTRIGVRVTGFGTHRGVCKQLLDEITQHLDGSPQRNPT